MKCIKQLIILSFVLILVSCSKETMIYPSGNIIKQTRQVSSFSYISISNGINVNLSQEDPGNITVEADDNIIDYIETYVTSNTLYIKEKDGTDINYKKTVNINVPAKQIKSLSASGGSEIKALTPFYLNSLDIMTSGGSEFTGEFYVNSLYYNISGGGDISLTGKCNQLHLISSGGSNNELLGLISDDARLEISGGSTVRIYANRTLNVHASGGSKIYYKGKAVITGQNLEGGSTISKIQ